MPNCCQRLSKVSGLAEASFLRNGYTNWKDATRNFTNHEKTDFHRQAAVALQPKKDVSEMLSSKVATDKQNNQDYLLRILTFLESSHQLSI